MLTLQSCRVDIGVGDHRGLALEVRLVARKPEVFVRSLEPTEAQRLVKMTRSAKDRVRLRRAGIVLASMQGRSAGEIAMMFAATEATCGR